jgi:hypothetical protein
VCDGLRITSRKPSRKARKRPLKPGTDKRRRVPLIEASCFEAITTAAVSGFITNLVRARGPSPKTANHYRQIITRVFNWAMKGESLYKISALMGNSPEICRRHYAALVPEAMADTVEFGQPGPANTVHPMARAQ